MVAFSGSSLVLTPFARRALADVTSQGGGIPVETQVSENQQESRNLAKPPLSGGAVGAANILDVTRMAY